MQILWVKAGKLLPVDTGGKIRSFNLLRQLSLRNEVTLLSYYGGVPDRAYDDELSKPNPTAGTVVPGAAANLGHNTTAGASGPDI